MKEWKVKQEIFHRLNRSYKDDLNKVTISYTDDTVNDAIRHFHEKIDEWIYPAKSYFVAICYAQWIAEDFNEDFYQLLNDPDLLYGNDPHFVTYKEDVDTYDNIIKEIDWPIPMKGMVPDVREYYEEEILFKG